MVVRRHLFTDLDGNTVLIAIGTLLVIIALIYLIDFIVQRFRKRKLNLKLQESVKTIPEKEIQ